VDTAELYAVPTSAETFGRTEEILGNWITARGARDKIVLASKVAGPMGHNRMAAVRCAALLLWPACVRTGLCSDK
jgi:aryl-alcohol dehydrogenase-like predicted oxidoreductase